MFLILVKGEIERSLLENCYQCDGSWKNPRTSGSDCIPATLLFDCFHGNGCQLKMEKMRVWKQLLF